MGITIVGLGPGDKRHLTLEVWEVLGSAETVHVRTTDHPVIAQMPPSLQVIGFDALYEASADFEQVYATIVETIVAAGRDSDVIYAVPGHPYVAEASVAGIVAAASAENIRVQVLDGLSFVEPALRLLGIDALDGIQIHDAIVLARHYYPPISPDMPLLLGQVYSRFMASELKLALMSVYSAETTVTLIHNAGLDNATIETTPLYAIDQSEQIRNLTALYVPARDQKGSLGHFADTIATLRSPDGCPWDQAQTPQSMRQSLLEEAAEVLDALDQDDPDALCEELGDLLLHIVMQAQMASEADEFTLTDVVAGVNAKIVRRHPHVWYSDAWGDVDKNNEAELSHIWQTVKAQEKAERGIAPATSVLDGVQAALPALARSQKIQDKARKVGFDWPSIDGVYAKLTEEIAEVQAAENSAERTDELGDVLFVVVNLASWLGVDAETALREANLKFQRRFMQVETIMQQRTIAFGDIDIDALEVLWREAKQIVG